MKITLFAVGALKDPAYREIQAHYLKLLSRYGAAEVREIKDEKLGAKRLSGAAREKAVAAEGARLLDALPPRDYLICLDVGGKERSSEELAKWLGDHTHRGHALAFAIGGPLGLSEAVRGRSRERLSLGKLTLPHQMARVVLLEQLYRAWTILKGETYHY